MVGQDREETNRLQQVKWELTSRIRDESNIPSIPFVPAITRKTLRAVARPGGPLPCGALQEYSGGAERTRGATLVSDGEPVQSGLVSALPSRIVELFHFGRGECAIVEACRPYRRCELR
jgi:hypothetical protein